MAIWPIGRRSVWLITTRSCALRLLRVPEGEVEDLAQSFLLKVAEKKFLQSYRAFQEKEAREGRRARFRTYLYRSIQHHVYDFHRQRGKQARGHSVLQPRVPIIRCRGIGIDVGTGCPLCP